MELQKHALPCPSLGDRWGSAPDHRGRETGSGRALARGVDGDGGGLGGELQELGLGGGGVTCSTVSGWGLPAVMLDRGRRRAAVLE